MKQKSIQISPFLSEEGKVTQLPARFAPRMAVLGYLIQRFEADRDYTEKQVNEICERWHTFGDYFLLRRELVDGGFLARERDGSRYWRTVTEEERG